MPRISVAWLAVLAILSVFGFFTYHILTANSNDSPVLESKNLTTGVSSVLEFPQPQHQAYAVPVKSNHHIEPITMEEPIQPQMGAEIDVPVKQYEMPVVAGQTEADLRETRPVMQTPPAVEYADPVARDVSTEPSYFESEFGDNLRHPEQTIELHPPMGSLRTPAAGLGSDIPMPDPITRSGTQYSPELAQNGGEFMSGIMAFDGMDAGGIGFSSI